MGGTNRATALCCAVLASACAVSTGLGAGVAKSTEPSDFVGSTDVSASSVTYDLAGYILLGPIELISGMTMTFIDLRARTTGEMPAVLPAEGAFSSLVYGGAGLSVPLPDGARVMPYAYYGYGLFDSDITPAAVQGMIEVGVELGLNQIWSGERFRHGFNLRLALQQYDGFINSYDLGVFDTSEGRYKARGVAFLTSWRFDMSAVFQ